LNNLKVDQKQKIKMQNKNLKILLSVANILRQSHRDEINKFLKKTDMASILVSDILTYKSKQ